MFVMMTNNVFNRITGMLKADLLRECMLRDGLMLQPDCITANDTDAVFTICAGMAA